MERTIILNNRGAFHPETSTLIVSDLHLGIRRNNRYSHMEFNFSEVKKRIDELLKSLKPEKLVLNGDIFNHFPIDEEALNIINNIPNKCNETIYVLGNHEEKFGGVHDVSLDDEIIIEEQGVMIGENIYASHGHKTPTEKAELHIVGHIHPVHNNNDCFAFCKNSYYGASVLILPAFSNMVNSSYSNNWSHVPIVKDGKSRSKYRFYSCNSNNKINF